MVGFDVNIFTDPFGRVAVVSLRRFHTMVTATLQTTDKIEARHEKEEDAVMRSDGAR